MVAAFPPIPDWQLLLIAIPLFFGFWSLVMAMASLIGGWNELAKRYRREEIKFSIRDERPAERFRWASLKMGPTYFPTNYGNCTTIDLSESGLGLNVALFFRPMHPPLLIPWTDIESCQLGKELWIFDRAKIQVRGLANPLRIYGRAARAIERYSAELCALHRRE